MAGPNDEKTFSAAQAKSWIDAVQGIVVKKMTSSKSYTFPIGIGVSCEISFTAEPDKDCIDALIKQLQLMKVHFPDQDRVTNEQLVKELYASVEKIFSVRP